MNDFKMLRPLRGGEVKQRTKDGFINATDLLRIGNKVRISKDLLPKDLKNYFLTDATGDLIETIKDKENLTSVKSASVGRNANTWFHPVLALDFALWLSPDLKYDVYKWMTDQLLIKRMDSSGSFKEMNIALDKRYNIGSKYWHYTNAADLIRRALKVTDWNSATESQLSQRDKIQNLVIFMCENNPTTPLDNLLHKAVDFILKPKKLKKIA